MHFLQRSLTLPSRFGIFCQSCGLRFSKPTLTNNTRGFFYIRKKNPRLELTEIKFKKSDNMPPTATLIYNNPFYIWITCIFHAQNFFFIALSTFTISIIGLYLKDKIKLPYVRGGKLIVRSETEYLMFTGILFFLIICSSLACRFSVLRIYVDKAKNENKAILVGNLPFLKRVLTIKPMSVSPVVRRFPVKDFVIFEFLVDGKRIIMHESYFRTPADLHRMLKFIH